MPRPSRSFFEREAPTVARELLGMRLVRVIEGSRVSGLIVETEAYRGRGDPASHAFRGKTHRNEAMFGPPGHAYVYFSMGVHYCLNVKAEGEGVPAAVLVRAVEPAEGFAIMKKNRGIRDVLRLARGPGNLTRAFGIGKRFNGEDLVASQRLFFETGVRVRRVGASPRVGVGAARSRRWRFYALGNRFVSGGRPHHRTKNP